METVDYGNPAYEEEYYKSCRTCGEPCEDDWCSDFCFTVWVDS